MKLIRYQWKDQAVSYGWVHNDMVGEVEGDIFNEFRRHEAHIPLSQVKLLPPVLPSKIICVGRNYVAHALEHGAEIPEIPILFLKPFSSLIGYQDEIRLPQQSSQVEHEGELVVVIGKRGHGITTEKAAEYILGYSIANDVTARDLQRLDGQWTRGKGFDTFCPIGPWIETQFDPADAMLTCRVNNEIRQMVSTREMIFSIGQLVAFISSIMTLEPGDVILTGTPAGVGPLHAGDLVEVEIEGIGVLSNPVVTE
ncbi:MAG: fumarylacetoacetate hydrolase family protein [Anaerolineaceae bacterium]|jgi:2-keto-4-pentenoate hydratase/2-oxohepta-3-ene-1,7-dioic acid hydratase in catechol pathway